MKAKTPIPTVLAIMLAAHLPAAAELRIGIIGTDTSHVIAFAHALNGQQDPQHVNGARVVIAYKGGSPEIKESRDRVDRFASELQTT